MKLQWGRLSSKIVRVSLLMVLVQSLLMKHMSDVVLAPCLPENHFLLVFLVWNFRRILRSPSHAGNHQLDNSPILLAPPLNFYNTSASLSQGNSVD
jgi:hypothetical protein